MPKDPRERARPTHGSRGEAGTPSPATTRRSSRAEAPLPQRRRGSAPPPPPPAQRGTLAGLFRGAGSMLGQVSGIDAPTRALERLAKSAEHAAAFLDRLDTEVGLERAAATLDRLDRLADMIEDMHRSLREIEERVVDLHLRVDKPLQRLSPMRRRRSPSPLDS